MISQGSALSTPLRSGLPDAAPVGLVLLRSAQPGQLDPFHQDFVRGVESRLAEAGRSLLVMLQADPEKELHTYRRWAARGRIAGVLLMNLRLGDERVPLLQELGLPAVVIGDPKISPAHPTAFTDDASAMADAMRYLMGLGHRRIARIAGPAELLHTAQRTEVYAAMLAEAGVGGVSGLQRNGGYGHDSGRTLTAELFAADAVAPADAAVPVVPADERPTAIIYDDAVMAVGGLETLRALGIAVPGQVSVLAWDDSLQCQLAGVSALSHDVAAYGELAAELLIGHLAGEPVTSRAALAPALVVRGSTGPVAEPVVTDRREA
ncbi:LacI family DNA-binding transcriptional regulator [Specibacter sp. AOP5-B1-6]|uniref:LacI family DNA-binding transcriptional regulator n=1 Tax=Specibacter sp. AOP5-B1-6 TaxID=3457653 RepID=UPI00402BEABF